MHEEKFEKKSLKKVRRKGNLQHHHSSPHLQWIFIIQFQNEFACSQDNIRCTLFHVNLDQVRKTKRNVEKLISYYFLFRRIN